MRWKRLSNTRRVSSAAQLCPLRKSSTLLVLMFLWCTHMTCAFSSPRTGLMRVRYRTQQFRLWSTRSNGIHSVAIIGGGMAGLSTAHHFIQKQPGIQITIFDKAPVGTAGASSVAGGYVPCSTRIYFVHATLVCLGRIHIFICYSSWSHKLMTTIISPRSLRLQKLNHCALHFMILLYSLGSFIHLFLLQTVASTVPSWKISVSRSFRITRNQRARRASK